MGYFQRSSLPNSHIRCCWQFRELGGFVRREWNAFGRRDRLWFTSRPQTLSAAVLDVHSTVSAGARNGSVRVSWYARCKIVRSAILSTQLRRT